MKIGFEQFNIATTLNNKRLDELVEVMRAMPAALLATHPHAQERYEDRQAARRAVAHAIRTKHLFNGMIIRDRAVVGPASLMGQQTFAHPALNGEVAKGTQIDYWAHDLSEEEHKLVGDVLFKYAKRHCAPVFGAQTAEEHEFGLGIPMKLSPLGTPASFTMPKGDPFGVLDSGNPVQLYTEARWLVPGTVEQK